MVGECGFGAFCQTAGEGTSTCKLYGTIADGTEIPAQMDSYCVSGYAMSQGDAPDTKFYCMPATKNTGDITTGKDSGATCDITSYTNPEDVTAETAGTNTALCGFNQGTSAYCPAEKGDSQY